MQKLIYPLYTSLFMFTTTYITWRTNILYYLHLLQTISQIDNINFPLIICHIPTNTALHSGLSDTVFYKNLNVIIVNYKYINTSVKCEYVSDNQEHRDESGLDKKDTYYLIKSLYCLYSMWCYYFFIKKYFINQKKEKK